MSDEKHEGCSLGDVALIPSESDSAGPCRIVRHRPDRGWTNAALLPMKDGAPLPPGAEVVEVGPRRPDGLTELRTLYRHEGPPRVTTAAYRAGYDAIDWSRKN